jgi:hypothetical protein
MILYPGFFLRTYGVIEPYARQCDHSEIATAESETARLCIEASEYTPS